MLSDPHMCFFLFRRFSTVWIFPIKNVSVFNPPVTCTPTFPCVGVGEEGRKEGAAQTKLFHSIQDDQHSKIGRMSIGVGCSWGISSD
ncbi:hypothetical protein MKW98_005759 [Papaver atlanticum]|uniref:Uncharacterized protein n=1 Tax=Papaver atlanticum TaxID=357466 RepID=A0AAD4X6C8_9MAGN|nr:hypothetical protein MKW98_005759 [Papaver atlanticum]